MGIETKSGDTRIEMLDGWRALSILLVMSGHWLPIGPKAWQLNAAVAASGMAIFFILSGFLITHLLLRNDNVVPFLIRRFFRVLPLAWAAIAILVVIFPGNATHLFSNLAFYANIPPVSLMEGGAHLWSLCVELQFYVLTAALVLAGRGYRALYLLPLIGLAVTALRIYDGVPINIVTWYRVDEIMAGVSLALVTARYDALLKSLRFPIWAPLAIAALLLASAHPALPALNYARPYLAASMIGISLYSAPRWMRLIWASRPAAYVAQISYALYVVHGVLTATWLGGAGANVLERYARRPLLIAATFAIAHVSTFYYESRWIAAGRRLSHRAARTATPAAQPVI